MRNAERLVLAHLWLAFAVFAPRAVLGVWQMWVRSPLQAPYRTPGELFPVGDGAWRLDGLCADDVLHHGVRLFRRRDGARPDAARRSAGPGPPSRWASIGAVMAVDHGPGRPRLGALHLLPAADRERVLLYRPGAGRGRVVDLVRDHDRRDGANGSAPIPGQPVPLAMFATVANAIMWLWTTVGVAVELLFQVIPAAFGWTETIDVGLSRTLFSWTLHAIVYFWLFPAYIAFYTMAPEAAGGRLYSDTMGRLTFVLFLLYSLPVGMHHLFMDPEHSTGFKFVQSF